MYKLCFQLKLEKWSNTVKLFQGPTLIFCLFYKLNQMIILQASEFIALLEEGVRTHYVPPHLTVVS